jgi:hypothetical protein
MRSLAFALLAIAAGCGSSVEPFVGSWLVTNSDGTNICPPVSNDITGTQDIFTLSASDGELVRDNCKLRLRVSGDRASLVAPADCDYGPLDTFHYKRFDLQTTDGKTISGAVMGQYESNSPGCTITAHFAGSRTTR